MAKDQYSPKLAIPFFVTGLNRRNEDGTFRFTITDEDRAEAKKRPQFGL
jgi:hypothetical protein